MRQYKQYLKILLGMSATGVFLLAASCGGSSIEGVTNLETKVTSLEAQLVDANKKVAVLTETLEQVKEASIRAQVIGTLRHIEAAEFHIMNINIQEGNLDPRYPATVDQVVATTIATDWPSELSDTADAFIESAKSLSAVLAAEDSDQAGSVSTAAHGLYHALSHAAFVWLNGGEELGADPHAGHDMSSSSSHEGHDMSDSSSHEGHGTDATDSEDHSAHEATAEPTADHSAHEATPEPTADHSAHEATPEPTVDPHAGHTPTATPDPHAGH